MHPLDLASECIGLHLVAHAGMGKILCCGKNTVIQAVQPLLHLLCLR